MTELGKLGADVEEGRDYCVITPPKAVKSGVAIDTYDDHRMVRQEIIVGTHKCVLSSVFTSNRFFFLYTQPHQYTQGSVLVLHPREIPGTNYVVTD